MFNSFIRPVWIKLERSASPSFLVGWSDSARLCHLPLVVNHSRFLILPWTQIPNLASHILARAGLLMSPLIPWRPPGDRPPSPAELAICLPFLFRLVALAAPRRLALLGPLAAKALLGQSSRRRPRGAWLDVAIPGLPQTLPALPTFAPGELVRNVRDRRSAWADLRLLRRTLDADFTDD